MAARAQRTPRRTDALSKQLIVEAATQILDADGENALTFRALTTRLSTGYGAIYHHVASKSDLLAAATDNAIAYVVTDLDPAAEPAHGLRTVALGLFDVISAHPWVGTQLAREPWRPALLDIYERVGELLSALNIPERALFDSAGALVNYVLGVAGQNAANARLLADHKADRTAFLATVATQWTKLDPARYPLLHKAATRLPDHDDREQFLAGVDLILAGINTTAQHGAQN